MIGLGSVGKSLIVLLKEKEEALRSLGVHLKVVSISDSKGTAIDEKGLDLEEVLAYKDVGWRNCRQYVKGYKALDSIRNVQSETVVELSPSTASGEPGLSHIKIALMKKKNAVTANKGPLVVAYESLVQLAERNHVRLLYEATVAAHLPVFCMVDSCFRADELLSLQGILNATTNFIIGEMEEGGCFEDALNRAIEAGWAETNYSDDVDGIDAARKTVILANSLFKQRARLKDVQVIGIRKIGSMVRRAIKTNKRVKLICEIKKKDNGLDLCVEPRFIPLGDPLVTVNKGDMGMKLTFKTSRQIFVLAQFSGPRQAAFAVLNDLVRIAQPAKVC